jgi:4-alpha-glucanotransferase
MLPRASGVLLHPTSLPGEYGIGEIGAAARKFIDCLAATDQRFWQVLPLGPTFYSHSPYQSSSTFAGNPNLISLDELTPTLLKPDELADHPPFRQRIVEFEPVLRWREEMLDLAFERFLMHHDDRSDDFISFTTEHAAWLDDYALFMALKEANQNRPWNLWPKGQALYAELEIREAKQALRIPIIKHKFKQWLFFRQWQALKGYANKQGIEIIGDLPIYVAMDSADVWRHRNLFDLNSDGYPNAVAGVPPDYFSATGQLWGNPLYRWGEHQRTGFAWWIERVKASLRMFDRVRIDHFRAFYNYWQVPAGDTTAQNGKWIENEEAAGMGTALFSALQTALARPLGEVIIAEDLGANMDKIIAWREESLQLPGMEILQFAFGDDASERGRFTPIREQIRNNILYTGTHDNNTLQGWWSIDAGERGQQRLKTFAEKWHEQAWDGSNPRQTMIEIGMEASTNVFIMPLQDVLGLGATARMNTPATDSDNWRWRCKESDLDPASDEWQYVKRMTVQHKRGR